MGSPRIAHYDKIHNMPDNEIKTNEINDNAVNYKKLDQTGRSYKLEIVYSATEGAAVNFDHVMGVVSYSGIVTSVKYIPNSSFTPTPTDTVTLRVSNAGNEGLTDIVLAADTFTSVVSAWAPKTLNLSAPTVTVNSGDILIFEKTYTNAGAVVSTGKVEVIIERSV